MNIVLLSGGLGNQMFQYAFYLSLMEKGKKAVLNDYLIRREKPHNGLELTTVFYIPVDSSKLYLLASRLIRKFVVLNNYMSQIGLFLLNSLGIHLIKEEQDALFEDKYFSQQGNTCFYWGYWQTEKYFSGVSELIRNAYSFNIDKLSLASQKALTDIQLSNSISIHIRRGDYFSAENKKIYGNICSSEYYQKSLLLLKEKVCKPVFFVFSDDIDWVKKNLNLPDAIYVDWNRGADAWQDMCLMSNCTHNIIANSSFSWWGAWLNANPNKIVVAPSRFLNTSDTPDILPETWIKIPV